MAMTELEMVRIARENGFRIRGARMEDPTAPTRGSENIKITVARRSWDYELEMVTFHWSPLSVNHSCYVAEGSWVLRKSNQTVAIGHDPRHLRHELESIR